MESRYDDIVTAERPHDRVMLARFAGHEWTACPWCAVLMVATLDVANAATDAVGAGRFDGCKCNRCGRRFFVGDGWQ